MRVTVWNEFRHERNKDEVRAVYPEGMHAVLADAIREGLGGDVQVGTATLDEAEHGLPPAVLNSTDVLLWWGHGAHEEVRDEVVDRVVARVLDGMGLIVLHSGHYSKVFKRLMGTSCSLKWHLDDRERLWVVDPAHRIAAGVPEHWDLDPEEMYGEPFGIPAPEELVFVSWFAGGNVFRSGCCYHRGRGRIFYFRPGHESYPTYHHPVVRRVITNGVSWAAPSGGPEPLYHHSPAIEPLPNGGTRHE